MTVQTPDKPRSEAHANQCLADAPYIAYAIAQACKLLISLLGKRWPEVR